MAIPSFVNGEILSAMRLNALVDAANALQVTTSSIVVPFEQVQIDAGENGHINSGADWWWTWLFRYSTINRYWRFRYVWYDPGVNTGATVQVWVNTFKMFQASVQAPGTYDVLIDLQGTPIGGGSLGLIDGTMNEIKIYAQRGSAEYFRVLWFYNSNNGA